MAALAQETRLNIFRLLVRHAPNGLAAGTIAHRLRQPGPMLSFHFKCWPQLGSFGQIRTDGPSLLPRSWTPSTAWRGSSWRIAAAGEADVRR